MRVSLWLLVSVLAASPVSAQTATSAYEQGVAARRAGDATRAATLLEQAVRADPSSADARVQHGYALLALGRLDEAEHAFDESLRLAPGDNDTRVGQALIAERRGNLRRARTLVAPVASNDEEANALRRRLATGRGETRWSLDIDGSATRLNNDQPDWRQLDIQLSHRLDNGARVAGRIETARRFDRTDAYGEMRGEWPVSSASSVYLLGGGTPGADFRPRWQVGTGGRVRVTGGAAPTVLTLDARHASYRSGSISLINPGIEQYLAAGKAWITLQSINLVDDGAIRSGWLARIDLMAGDRVRLFGGAANAPDVDQGIVSRTRSLFAGASVGLNETADLRVSVSRDRPGIGADRTGFSLGTMVRF
ncbi:MAG: YaiO family outer membrane beta-barrel protein [Sphingomonas bacterium]|nr:YaiO family outer membrane beta-barrel protein [Sphingomonas bacterium]